MALHFLLLFNFHIPVSSQISVNKIASSCSIPCRWVCEVRHDLLVAPTAAEVIRFDQGNRYRISKLSSLNCGTHPPIGAFLA